MSKTSSETDREEAPFLQSDYPEPIPQSWWSLGRASTFVVFQTVLLLFFVSIAILVAAATRHLWEPVTDRQCYEKFNFTAPAYEGVEYYETDFANAFTQESEYRGRPTSELEDRWAKLWRIGGISVPASNLAALNRSKEGYAQTSDGMYGAFLEVHHQIHCLNMIRQYTWLNEFNASFFGLEDGPKLNRMHVDHCIETLRLALMCRADTTPLLVRLGGEHGTKADFNSHHKCVKWDHFMEWVGDHVTWS
ncbi:hypothetical protein PSPO01_09726 [Paraphaeosphaeria sporulosa]